MWGRFFENEGMVLAKEISYINYIKIKK